jgi:hypothetical protein
MTDTGGPAFPFVFDDTATRSRQIYTGMSIRDYFAAKAMQAILNDAEIFWEGAAPLAYQYADAMLKERSK